jgi:hypothetical protein
MTAAAVEASDFGVPEYMTWDELDQLPGDLAKHIELWDRKVIWNQLRSLEHQRFAVRMRNAIEANARRAARESTDVERKRSWEVGKADVFFAVDKSRFLTPDFLVRRCLLPASDTNAADVALVGKVLSGLDTHRQRDWRMDQYAAAGIPWYWEVELDSGHSWDIAAIRAYELVVIPDTGLPVKPLRPAVYIPAGEWEPRDVAIEFPEPFSIYIAWEDLAF